MFHFKAKFIPIVSALLILISFSAAHAQESAAFSMEKIPRYLRESTISLEYLSWQELMRIDSGTQTDNAYADFFGNALTYEHENYHGQDGYAFSGSFLFGKANAGGTQSILTYETSQRSWIGFSATARYAHRLTPTVTASIGPMAMYRHVTWPDEGTGNSLKSGSDLNLGILGELGLRLFPQWEVRMEMGTLAFRASTYWSIGLGHKY
jgi:hypothetical protein